MDYIKRTYRKSFSQGRWAHFTLSYKETDLWIGIDHESFQPEMPSCAEKLTRELRDEMDAYLTTDPAYRKALTTYPAGKNAPLIFQQMSAVCEQTGIGPMSAVAGAVARYVALSLKARFQINEIIVENGGDIYADIKKDMDIAVFAGPSVLSEKVGLHIEADYAPLGICTSSGTVGPSLSFGKADAVMIICRDAALADSYATLFANKVQTADDTDRVLKEVSTIKEVIAAMVIKNDKMGICGMFELKLF